MSPRPRTVSDEEILGAAGRVIGRVGPTRVTLADVAREVGLSPATLVQRFGSKRGLLLALAEGAAESTGACFEMIRGQHPSPLDALLASATFMAQMVQSPEEMANQLAFLQIDLSDPDFYRHMRKSTDGLQAGYTALLDDAVSAGELVPCDTSRLARAVGSIAGGSLLTWAVVRTGSAEQYVREDLATLLEPYRAKSGIGTPRRPGPVRTPVHTRAVGGA
jgi:AcrR family transcriptional regulator